MRESEFGWEGDFWTYAHQAGWLEVEELRLSSPKDASTKLDAQPVAAATLLPVMGLHENAPKMNPADEILFKYGVETG